MLEITNTLNGGGIEGNEGRDYRQNSLSLAYTLQLPQVIDGCVAQLDGM